MIRRRRPDSPNDRPADEEPSVELPPEDTRGDADPETDADSSADTDASTGADETDAAKAGPTGASAGSADEDPPAHPNTPEGAGTDARPDADDPTADGPTRPGGDDPASADATADPASPNGPTDTRGPDTGPPAPQPRGGRGLALLALLVALVAAGAAGWAGWRLLQLEHRIAGIPAERAEALAPLAADEDLSALGRRVEGLAGEIDRRIADQIGGLEQRLARLEKERAATLERLGQRVQAAETAIRSLRAQRERTGLDWRMAEVRYLVSMAANRLGITGDVQGAIAALEAADTALGRMGDPRVLDLRDTIVERINALKQVEPADVAGIALRVQNLAPQIPGLVLASEAPPASTEAAPASEGSGEDASAGAGWWSALRKQLSGLVTVRREPTAAPPAPGQSMAGPAPSAELPAGERLLLALKDASRAALNHDPQAYDAALGRALSLLEAEYDGSAPVNQRFHQALKQLRERRVTTDLPDLGPTVERTRALAARLSGNGPAAQGGN